MAWQRLDRRRQAALLLKLLVVLLFAVSSLNFFIPWRLSTDERQAHDVFSSADNSKQILSSDASNDKTAVVISVGHLDGTLYLPSALRPKKLTRNRNNHDTTEDEWCCLIASPTYRPKRVACHGTCFLPSACTDTMYPHQSIKNKNSINKFDKSLLKIEVIM